MKGHLTNVQKRMGKTYIPFVLILFSAFLFFIMFSNVKPKALKIHLYQVAEETIRAQTTVEDTEKTEENRQIAADNVTPVFSYNADLNGIQTEKIQLLFAAIEDVNKLADEQYQEKLSKEKAALEAKKKEDKASEAEVTRLTPQEKLSLFNEKLIAIDDATKTFIQSLPEWVILDLLDASETVRKQIEDATTDIVSESMSKPIKLDELSKVKQESSTRLDYWDLTTNDQRIASLIIDNTIVENNIYNEKATQEQRKAASANVQPALILQGQVIVQEGHVVDSNAMHQMKLLGLLDAKPSYQMIYGLALLILAQALVLFYLGKSKKDPSVKQGHEITLYAFTMIGALLILKGLQLMQNADISNVSLLYPTALAPVLLTAFISRRYGIVSNGFLAAFSVFIFKADTGTSFSIVLALFYLLSGMMGTMITRKRIASQFWNTFIWTTLFNALFISSFILYLNMPFFTKKSLLMVAFALAGGLLSYFLAVILSPYVEVLFEENAVLTLTELENPNSPLLKELVTKAPGTYHHSLMVANLSANAVGAIGGDSLFARVACYYHDVGKLRHSLFFVENLSPGMENPHDLLTPFESKEIIFGHVSEGIKMLEEAKMPQTIIDICAQHHGTTLMKFFYIKAKELDPEVKESDFRYPGPKPQTKEAAVITIADSAEAAVRSMSNPSKKAIEEFIHQLINGRIADGQFDECDISMKELKIVEHSICEGLNGTFHSRIEYPNFKKTTDLKVTE
ncbi:MAG: HDIG domain-containing protein [Carnobacterium sp.]|uniref:HD family phosphohydrolase n=1 Tax=Carnobacterium sp. TaxID=48221 RepID=UPI002FCBD9B4